MIEVGNRYAFTKDDEIIPVTVTGVLNFASGLIMAVGDYQDQHVVMRAEGNILRAVKFFNPKNYDAAIKYVVEQSAIHSKLAA